MATETPLIEITSSAIEQLTSLMEEHKNEGQLLRIMVMPSQNGGIQYALGIEKEPQQTDTNIKVDNIEVLIDKDSVPLVEGAKIDYIDDLMRSGFIISNPNLPSGGGCGSGGGCACGGGDGGGGCGGGGCGGGGCGCGGGGGGCGGH